MGPPLHPFPLPGIKIPTLVTTQWFPSQLDWFLEYLSKYITTCPRTQMSLKMSYQSVVKPEAVAVLQRAAKLFRQLVGVNVGVELTHCHILGLKHMQQPLMIWFPSHALLFLLHL